jgi:hypothetical protein
VDASSAFGRTTFEDNRVEVDLGWTAPLSVSGPGAGGAPTATALLCDLLSEQNPCNERGTSRPPFTSAEDPRLHRWLVVGACTLPVLEKICRDASVFFESGAEHGGEAGVFVFCPWADLARLSDRLRAKSVASWVAREDDAGSRGNRE